MTGQDNQVIKDKSEKKSLKRKLTGKVVSNKMDKTVTVVIERRVKHPLYAKYLRKSTKVHAHDENNDCQNGDWVTVEERPPYSKTKSWEVVHIQQAQEA